MIRGERMRCRRFEPTHASLRVSNARSLARSVLIACFAMSLVIALPSGGVARRQDTVEDLMARIERENNPVKKAKLQVRLASLEVTRALSAYDQRHIREGQKSLAAAAAEIQDAWQLLRSTGRNAARKPDGFMQLEIGSREDARLLSELSRRTFYLYRGPIDATLKTINQLHSQVFLALFPGAAPSPKQGRATAPAYQHPKESKHP